MTDTVRQIGEREEREDISSLLYIHAHLTLLCTCTIIQSPRHHYYSDTCSDSYD